MWASASSHVKSSVDPPTEPRHRNGFCQGPSTHSPIPATNHRFASICSRIDAADIAHSNFSLQPLSAHAQALNLAARTRLGDLHSNNMEAIRTIESRRTVGPPLQALSLASPSRNSSTAGRFRSLFLYRRYLCTVPVMACTGTPPCRNPTWKSRETTETTRRMT